MLLMGKSLRSQPIRVEIPDYNFVRSKHNLLSLPGGDSLANLYFAKMRDLALLGKGQIRILNIGGSHIQADIYSHQLRKNLASFLPNLMSARGLVFPFSMANTNNPSNYKVSYSGKWTTTRNINRSFESPLGLAGIAVKTNDAEATFAVSFDVRDNYPHDFTTLRVLHTVDSNSYSLSWQGEDLPSIEKHTNHTVFRFTKPQKSILFKLVQTDSLQNQFVLQGFILDSEKPGFSYSAVGVNGASTASYLKCTLFEEHMNLFPPDIVFFGIGINDAHVANFSERGFFNNYEKLMKQIKSVNPEVFFVFITNNDSYGYNKKLNTNATLVQKVMYELATKHHGAVWDLFEVMGGLKSSSTWRNEDMMAKDRIHFSRMGYQLIGNLLFNAIMESFDIYLANQTE